MITDPHPATAALATSSAADLAADLAAGRTTSVALVRSLLERIAAVDVDGPGLGAVLALSADALEQAGARDAERASGIVRGPLHGLPVLVKDNIEAVGLPGTAGSLALAGRTVTRDSGLVAALRAAGLVVLGSTNLSEWANLRSPHSASGWSAVGGLTGNPWALDRAAGGSSSGSGAAVAAGLTPLAIGTETDGSITCPSSINGCVGLKPTLGLVSTEGVVPLSTTQDAPGPMARSVRDAALLLDALTGSTEYAEGIGSIRLSELSVGIATGWYSGHRGTDMLFATRVRELEALGVTATEASVTPVGAAGRAELMVLLGDLKADVDAYLAARPGDGARSLADVVAFNREHEDLEMAHFGQEFLEGALEAPGPGTDGYAEARRAGLAWALDQCLAPALEADGSPEFLLAPAYAPAWKSDLKAGDHLLGGGLASPAPSIAGWPVLCLPMGLVGGLPVGMVLIGRPNSEARLLAAGHALEEAFGLRAAGLLSPTWAPPSRG